MRYNINHVTRYTYGSTVELTTGVLRLKPVSRDGQVLERFSLKTDPPCLPPVGTDRRLRQCGLEPQDREATPRAHRRGSVARAASIARLCSNCRRRGRRWPRKRLSFRRSPSTALPSGIYPSRALSLFCEATDLRAHSFVPSGVLSMKRRWIWRVGSAPTSSTTPRRRR